LPIFTKPHRTAIGKTRKQRTLLLKPAIIDSPLPARQLSLFLKFRKEIDMIRTSHRLLLATLLAASSAIALAQTPAPAPIGEAPTKMQQRMAERHDQRMTKLKDQLKITQAQEAAWTAFTTSMQPPVEARRMNRDEFKNLTTPQRIDLMQERSAEREAWMKQRSETVKTFYAQLSPEQQKTFDEHANMMYGQKGKRESMRYRSGKH
jgi:Spy/CpxP family protein refolding chaperone